jgi:hypothetical protein
MKQSVIQKYNTQDFCNSLILQIFAARLKNLSVKNS